MGFGTYCAACSRIRAEMGNIDVWNAKRNLTKLQVNLQSFAAHRKI